MRGRNTEKGGAGGDKFILASEARVINPPLPPPRRYNDWSRDTLNGETGGDTVPWTGEKGGGVERMALINLVLRQESLNT